jgi:hypothetical protein
MTTERRSCFPSAFPTDDARENLCLIEPAVKPSQPMERYRKKDGDWIIRQASRRRGQHPAKYFIVRTDASVLEPMQRRTKDGRRVMRCDRHAIDPIDSPLLETHGIKHYRGFT